MVSVRLEEDLTQQLDALADRRGRSKGFYLRLVLRAVLPTLEEYHWNQVAARFEDSAIDLQFREIMSTHRRSKQNKRTGIASLAFPLYGTWLYRHIAMCITIGFFNRAMEFLPHKAHSLILDNQDYP